MFRSYWRMEQILAQRTAIEVASCCPSIVKALQTAIVAAHDRACVGGERTSTLQTTHDIFTQMPLAWAAAMWHQARLEVRTTSAC